MISQKLQTGECNICVTPVSRLKPVGFALNSPAFNARTRLKSLSRGLGAAVFLLCACYSSHAALPVGWGDVDVGSPAFAGSASYDSNTVWTVTGSGNDIWNNGDQFNYCTNSLNGDGMPVETFL